MQEQSVKPLSDGIESHAEHVISSAIHQEQKHGIPLLLSVFVIGAGQIVKGQFFKGALILLTPLLIFAIIGVVFEVISPRLSPSEKPWVSGYLFGFGGLCYIVLYIWQLVDAYNSNE